jgi:small-conductance mechanosensitive channel
MHISDVTRWLRSDGLQIVLFIVGAILAGRLVHWSTRRYVARLDKRERLLEADTLMPDDQVRHLHTLALAAEWLAVGVVYIVAFLLIVTRFHLPLTSFVVPATAVGAAVGFGAQRVVQDILAGVFLFSERQYGFGDSVMIAPVGTTTGITGTVEEVTLRTTRLRTVQGELVIIPNGSIQQVVNRSRDWSRVLIDVPIPLDQDVDKALTVLRTVSSTMAEEEEWHKLLLEPPVVAGVESIQTAFVLLRISARTLPTKQVAVGRELRRRIAQGLREAGIASTVAA